jgi:hypothetical protein
MTRFRYRAEGGIVMFKTHLVLFSLLLASAASVGVPARGSELIAGKGEWQSNSGAAMRGTWNVSMTRTGEDLTGQLTLKGSLLFSGAAVRGSLDGDDVMFGAVIDGENQLVFNGTVSDGQVTGEWSCTSINDSGKWSGTLETAAPAAP